MYQIPVRGNERKSKNLCGSRKKLIGRITVG